MKSKNLTVKQIKNMSQDQILDMYKNGYKLTLSPAVCPISKRYGTAGSITVSANSGTPPYIFKVYIDGNLIYTYNGSLTETLHEFSHTFVESIDTHEYGGEVVDSCPVESGGPKTSTRDTCNITIIGCPIPVASLTISI